MTIAGPTKAQIARAIQAWQSCGLSVGGVEINGSVIRILAPGDETALTSRPGDEASCDKAFGTAK